MQKSSLNHRACIAGTCYYYVCHAVPASPTGVSVLRLNGTHMNVSWNQIPLSEAGGFIVTYRVLYNKFTTERRRRQIMVFPVPGSETNALIGDLDPPSNYQVYVSAATSAGEGEFTSIPVVARSKLPTIIQCFIVYFLYYLHKFTCVKYACVCQHFMKSG